MCALSPLVEDESDGAAAAPEGDMKTNSAWILEMFLCHKVDPKFSVSEALTTLGEEEMALDDWGPLEVAGVDNTECVENNKDQINPIVLDKLDDAATVPEEGVENTNDRQTPLVKDRSDESTCKAVPGGDDNSTYAPVADDDSEGTESSADSSDTTSTVETQSGFEMALLRLQNSLSLPDVMDHAANIIYDEAVRVGLYSYGSSDSTEASITSSLNDGIRLYSCDSSCDKDASVTSRKVENIYDISIGLPPSHGNE